MTKTDWTAEEVQAEAHRHGDHVADMLTAFAERIAPDESAAPVAWMRRTIRHKRIGGREEGERVMSASKVYPDDEPLFTHPPAQPTQETPCSLNEALNVIEHWGRRGNTLNGDDVDRFRALADKIAPAQEQPGWSREQAKLHERKTVHEWLNDIHIERAEFGRPLCLLRRLRILCDRYDDTCNQLSYEIRNREGFARWINIEEGKPPRNECVIYWHESEHGGYPAIADEWRDEHHSAVASYWMHCVPPSYPTPPKEN